MLRGRYPFWRPSPKNPRKLTCPFCGQSSMRKMQDGRFISDYDYANVSQIYIKPESNDISSFDLINILQNKIADISLEDGSILIYYYEPTHKNDMGSDAYQFTCPCCRNTFYYTKIKDVNDIMYPLRYYTFTQLNYLEAWLDIFYNNVVIPWINDHG